MAARASNWWCAAGALCATTPGISALLPGDRVLCPHDAWTNSSGCVASPVTDPYYETNAWAYTLINLQPAWAAGYTGAGVTINIVDDGPDQTHPAFSGKYDALGSCPLPFQFDDQHGTTTAAIALAAANGQCSRGVAYGATLSECAFNNTLDNEQFIFNMARNHISSNSWGFAPCIALASSGRRKLRQRQLQGCPFAASGTSPCYYPQCAGASWTSPPSTCETFISFYCQNPDNYDADGECASWTHLWATCAYRLAAWDTNRVLQRGVLEGRSGRGIVYVFAAGNDNRIGEDVNMEQYYHSRFTITVGATDKLGLHAYYSTTGSSLFITAPGGDTHQHSHNWYVAKAGGGCAEQGEGTSYACPVVSGVVTLMLEANPLLTYRDVQGILAATTSRNDPTSPLWTTNAAGFIHNIRYGFGMVDAGAAVAAALSWTNWGIERRIIASSSQQLTVPHDGSTLSTNVTVGAQSQAWAIEWIEIFLNLDHSSRGDLQLELTSPSGTHSVLIPGPRPETSNPPVDGCSAAADTCIFNNDGICDNPEYCECDYDDCLAANWVGANGQPSLYLPRFNWKMTSVRSWGESPVGTWTLAIRDRRLANGPNVNSTLHSWNLLIYGHHGTATRLSNRNTSMTITGTPLPRGATLPPPSPLPPPPSSVALGFGLGIVLGVILLGGGLGMIAILCFCFSRYRGQGKARSPARGRAQITEIGIGGASTGTGTGSATPREPSAEMEDFNSRL
jgi:subtilisin-like proprotein convertase family protein